MGAHHLADAEAARVTRVAGRGALVASTALALTGTGGGLALATPDHGSDAAHAWGHDSGEEWGHEDADDWGHEAWGHEVDSSDTSSCDPESAGMLGDSVFGNAALDDLGLTSAPEELCSTSTDDGHGSDDHESYGHGSEGHESYGHGSSDHDTGHDSGAGQDSGAGHDSGAAADSASGAAPTQPASTTTTTPINPADVPPPPGETKVIDLPDQPSGQV